MLPSERKRVQDVIDCLTSARDSDCDSLGIVELVMELEEEFGAEPVKWALRLLESRDGGRDPMWDRDLDG